MLQKHLALGLIGCALSIAGRPGATPSQLLDHPRGSATRESLHPRQTPIVVAPPPEFRTSLAPQPTSLNYWWPYGPNGVNPTATTISISSPEATDAEETDSADDTSTEIRSTTLPTALSSTAFPTWISTAPIPTSTKTEESTTDSTSKETEIAEPTTSGNDSFSVVTLLPLFIILGVLAAATLVGWAYGHWTRRCRRAGEPTPGGPDIGGKPYGGGHDSDTIEPLYPLGVGWVDASRIHSQRNLSSGDYYAIRDDHIHEEAETPSKNKSNKRGARNWFHYTLSGRKRAVNSPSGEKGLNAPLAHTTHDRQLPVGLHNTFTSGPYLSHSRSLQVDDMSPATGSNLFSPVTSAQPTPPLSASRHASLRRKIANKVSQGDRNHFSTSATLEGALGDVDHEGSSSYAENWAVFKGDPYKRSLGRRYISPNVDSTSLAWSPDPEIHRERMRRLRAAAEAAHCVSPVSGIPLSLSRPENVTHPFPPAPAVLVSPPLQSHLFFTRANSDDSECHDASESAVSKPRVARSGPSRNLTRNSNKPGFDNSDLFGPRAPIISSTGRRARKGKGRAQRHMATESTETLPLSPELRGAAMTKLDEIVKSHWSVRDLARVHQSPTLYGALSSPPGSYAKLEDDPRQVGIEETLLASLRAAHTYLE